MESIRTHQFHFDKQMITLYDRFKKYAIDINDFDCIVCDFFKLQKFTFSFGGYITYYAFNPISKFLYHTKPKDILDDIRKENHRLIDETIELQDDPRWLPVIEKIEQYPVTHQI